MKYFVPRNKLSYPERGESCFIKQGETYYLRRPIENRFCNGMTWQNYGSLWTIIGPKNIDFMCCNGRPELL